MGLRSFRNDKEVIQMSMKSQIEQKLSSSFEGGFLEVTDESHMHSRGEESHFKVVLVSDQFASKRSVARHQMIYGLLRDEIAGSVHALALHTYTPEEWEESTGAPASPNCLGGSKFDPVNKKY